jgi:hypothetical protein
MRFGLFPFYIAIFLGLSSSSQSFKPVGYAERAQKFLASLDSEELEEGHFSFDDSLRTRWERLPGMRQGLKLSRLTEPQKILFHELLRSCLSTQGYLTVTSVMFNEDIEKKFEPTLGRNEYWIDMFGHPAAGAAWGWKLEGHHLSLNFTFRGDQMISNSPFLAATNPSNSVTDSARAGLIILYKQEELARDLVNSFSEEQLMLGYSSRKKPDSVYSEQDRGRIHVPDEGIYFNRLTQAQQAIGRLLITEYFDQFNPGEIIPIDSFCNNKLRFFYIDSRQKGKPHYYRLENGKQIIEYENYANHIHCFWRTSNDFGLETLHHL